MANPEPYYIVRQEVQGARLFVWVQHGPDDDENWKPRFHERATSKPARYCKILAKTQRYADRKNARRASLLTVMKKGC